MVMMTGTPTRKAATASLLAIAVVIAVTAASTTTASAAGSKGLIGTRMKINGRYFGFNKPHRCASGLANPTLVGGTVKVEVLWQQNGQAVCDKIVLFHGPSCNGKALETVEQDVLGVKSLSKAFMSARCISGGANTTPTTDTNAPATDNNTPATDTNAPATDTNAPATDTNAPATDTNAPPTDDNLPIYSTQKASTSTYRGVVGRRMTINGQRFGFNSPRNCAANMLNVGDGTLNVEILWQRNGEAACDKIVFFRGTICNGAAVATVMRDEIGIMQAPYPYLSARCIVGGNDS
ncbi:unnamed protein product [Closterium sp. Yama58-4]|nr:unnamed protein product [Closterium sp. Yama58-4]